MLLSLAGASTSSSSYAPKPHALNDNEKEGMHMSQIQHPTIQIHGRTSHISRFIRRQAKRGVADVTWPLKACQKQV